MLQACLWSQLALEVGSGERGVARGEPCKLRDLALHSEQALNYSRDTVLCTAYQRQGGSVREECGRHSRLRRQQKQPRTGVWPSCKGVKSLVGVIQEGNSRQQDLDRSKGLGSTCQLVGMRSTQSSKPKEDKTGKHPATYL